MSWFANTSLNDCGITHFSEYGERWHLKGGDKTVCAWKKGNLRSTWKAEIDSDRQGAERKLSNTPFYMLPSSEPIGNDQKTLCHQPNNFLRQHKNNSTETYPKTPKRERVYLRTKIWKQDNPGCPIFRGISTFTAGYLAMRTLYSSLTPLALWNIIDFQRKLQSIWEHMENTILATINVTALYTKILCEEHQEYYPGWCHYTSGNWVCDLVPTNTDFNLRTT